MYFPLYFSRDLPILKNLLKRPVSLPEKDTDVFGVITES